MIKWRVFKIGKFIFNKSKGDCRDGLLELAYKYFDHEFEITNRMEGKSSIFIGSIGVMFTLSSAYFEFDEPSKISMFIKLLTIHLFIISTIFFFISIVCFINVLNIKVHSIPDYKEIFNENYIYEHSNEDFKNELIVTYRDILLKLREINDKKANNYKKGCVLFGIGIFFSFVLMVINFIY